MDVETRRAEDIELKHDCVYDSDLYYFTRFKVSFEENDGLVVRVAVRVCDYKILMGFTEGPFIWDIPGVYRLSKMEIINCFCIKIYELRVIVIQGSDVIKNDPSKAILNPIDYPEGSGWLG